MIMKTYAWIFFAIAVVSFIGSFTVDHDAPIILTVICGLFAAYLLNKAYSYNYIHERKNAKKWNKTHHKTNNTTPDNRMNKPADKTRN